MPHKYFHIHFRPDDGAGSGSGDGGGNSGDGSGTQDGTPPAGNGGGTGAPDVEALQRELQQVRQESAKRRTENATLTARLEELEGAGKTEAEKKDGKITELTQKTSEQEATIRALRVRVLASQAGITDPKAAADAASLFDWSQVQDPSSETEVVKALQALVKDRPYLGGSVAGGGDGGEGAGSRGAGEKTDMNTLIRQAAGRE